ncbi:MAG: FAD-dependent monooxygenase [Gammaproteobacteria bacterium]|nr:FAD-dependent monooxygenase [Gammaproteobacteria bacterium]
MKVNIVGAGPAGLYLAYLLRRLDDNHEVTVYEQNPASVTWGFGVVFSDRALEFLRGDDPDTCEFLSAHLERWDDITVVHGTSAMAVDGNGFGAIGRLDMLELLAGRARAAGADIRYGGRIDDVDALADADLLVGADGVNSAVRRAGEEVFGYRVEYRPNRFIWYGTTQPFDTLTLTFRPTQHGVFCAHHYRYRPEMSTFLVEVTEDTRHRAGFERMDEAATIAHCERVFAEDLDGHPIVSNRSYWRRFPVVTNERWSSGNRVLIGDAVRTVHFSIGSGTRLAMEDALALARSIGEHRADVPAALAAWEATRRPTTDKLCRAAHASLRWYEDMDRNIALAPMDFAHSYMTRTGRVGDEELARIAPRFMAAWRARAAGRP